MQPDLPHLGLQLGTRSTTIIHGEGYSIPDPTSYTPWSKSIQKRWSASVRQRLVTQAEQHPTRAAQFLLRKHMGRRHLGATLAKLFHGTHAHIIVPSPINSLLKCVLSNGAKRHATYAPYVAHNPRHYYIRSPVAPPSMTLSQRHTIVPFNPFNRSYHKLSLPMIAIGLLHLGHSFLLWLA